MTPERAVRIALGLLTVVALQVGLWATLSPRSFYEDFPGAGRVWVAVDGPYNEHLVRDVGELNLALGVVTVVALVTLSRTTVMAAAAAWVIYSVPHWIYHLRPLDPYEGADTTAVPVTLGLAVLVAGYVGWTAWRHPDFGLR
jgi:hypothetical protein